MLFWKSIEMAHRNAPRRLLPRMELSREFPSRSKTTSASRACKRPAAHDILGDYHPPYNATVIERLLGAGAVVIGKTNCDEFAMGSSNENSAFGPVRESWDTTSRCRAVHLEARQRRLQRALCRLLLGSDTGGSVRLPASLLRRVWFETNLRTQLPLWTGSVWFLARSGWDIRPNYAEMSPGFWE